MANERVIGVSESGQPPRNFSIPFPYRERGQVLFHHHPTNSFINQQLCGFDFGELEEGLIRNDEEEGCCSAEAAFLRAATTLEMFPSYLHTPRPRGSCSKSGEEETSSDSGSSALNNSTLLLSSSSKLVDHHLLHPESPISKNPATSPSFFLQHTMATDHHNNTPATTITITRGGGPSHNQPSPKPTQEKTLRRLAQNREAARKSRLRKKAYVQQLETSRIKLSQLEQDLQRARSQGFFMGGGASTSISSEAAIFDMEYARWLDDDHRHMSELRTGLQAHLSDGDLRVTVDVYISHYDELFQLKAVAAKSDVFHLITGMWTSPAERCFLWMAGFRPSDLIKMLITQLDPLTEQQVMGIYSLQHSSQQAEEALSQGLEQLQQSMVDTIAGVAVTDGMQQMAMALGKLTNLEGFVRQADNLRQQTLHQLRRILTVRQAARCFLVIGEYYGRLRALSSLWASRPRDQSAVMSDDNSCQTTMDLQMVQAASQNHFSSF